MTMFSSLKLGIQYDKFFLDIKMVSCADLVQKVGEYDQEAGRH